MERRLLMCWVPLSATAQSQYTFVHLELFPSTVTAVVIPVLSSHIQSITRNLHRISRHGFLNRFRDLGSVLGRACVAFVWLRTAAASRAA